MPQPCDPTRLTQSPRRRSRRLGVALILVAIGSLILAPEALANFFTPKSGGSPNANAIHSLYKIILYIAAVVFVVVEGALVYSVYRFRAKKGAVAAQIHGNTRLEIGWTVGAALILVVLTVITFVKLPTILNPPNSSANGFLTASLTQPTPPNGKELTVCVQGRQYIWRYTYGNDCNNGAFDFKLPYSYTEMVVPGEHDDRSQDPVHRRDPQLVGAVTRREGRRRPRLHHLHLVQGAARGLGLPRTVRPAVRAPALRDDRVRQGGHACSSTPPGSSTRRKAIAHGQRVGSGPASDPDEERKPVGDDDGDHRSSDQSRYRRSSPTRCRDRARPSAGSTG